MSSTVLPMPLLAPASLLAPVSLLAPASLLAPMPRLVPASPTPVPLGEEPTPELLDDEPLGVVPVPASLASGEAAPELLLEPAAPGLDGIALPLLEPLEPAPDAAEPESAPAPAGE